MKTANIIAGLAIGVAIVTLSIAILTARRVVALEKKVARFEEVLNP